MIYLFIILCILLIILFLCLLILDHFIYDGIIYFRYEDEIDKLIHVEFFNNIKTIDKKIIRLKLKKIK